MWLRQIYFKTWTTSTWNPTSQKIPVVSKVSAGLPIYSEENLIDYIYFATNKLNSDKEEFGLKVSGDSMDKIFQDGDIVVVEKDSVVENGQLGVVMINGYNATVKRIRYNGDQIILIPESTILAITHKCMAKMTK